MTITRDNTIEALASSPPAGLSGESHGAPDAAIDVLFCDEALRTVPLGSLVKAARACGAHAPVLVLVGDATPGDRLDIAKDLCGWASGPLASCAGVADADDVDDIDDADDGGGAAGGAADRAPAELWFGLASREAFVSTAPRVLVADDDPDLREVVAQALVDIGFDVIEAADGQEAVAVARHIIQHRPGGARLDLVVSDICMPGGDGLSVIAELHALEDELPVIVMSGLGEEELQRCERAGAHAVLSKPFDIDDLCELAREVASWRHP